MACSRIVTTAATRELARLVMLDAAHLHEEEAEWKARRKARSVEEREETGPLYTVLDALNAQDYFAPAAAYGKPVQLAKGVRAVFLDAGHILGSAIVQIQLEEHGEQRTVLFSGDLGNSGRPALRDPAVPPKSDVVVMETTYGDRLHKPLKPSIEELYTAIRDTFERGGNVVIPTFALERSQEILYYLREGVENGRISRSTPVYLDSPMAISATQIFEHHPECLDSETLAVIRSGRDPFHLPGLHFTRESGASKAINEVKNGAVIMAGSGMCPGGRVRHHLKHNLWRNDSSVIFVGFAAEGTLARLIIDGAKQVRIFGEEIPVRARVHTINGFSAHADRDELLAWHEQVSPKRTFLVHGEEATMKKFASRLQGTKVELPGLHESFAL